MADRNRNRGYPSNSREDLANDRNRFDQQNDINQPYGGVGYGDWNYESGHNDLDRNRYNNERRSNYDNMDYDSSGGYGYRNDIDWNSRDVYGGSYNPNYGYGRMDDGNRRSWREGRGDIYGNDYSGIQWNRRNMNGNHNDYRRNDYGAGFGYGSQMGSRYGTTGGTGYSGRQDWQNREMSRYGGDTSNHGNMNQGGMDRDWWDRTKDEVSSWFGDDDAERRRSMDRMNTNNGYRGKGPRNYHRSEERIREDVCDRLTDDDLLDASNINIEVHGDEAILTGTVDSREQKRRAEDLVESVSGIRNVENRIKISRNDDMTSNLRIRDEGERSEF